eukprot:1014023_1
MGSDRSKPTKPLEGQQWVLLGATFVNRVCQVQLALVDQWPQNRAHVAREIGSKDEFERQSHESLFYAKNRTIGPRGYWEPFRYDHQGRTVASQSIQSPNDGSFVVAEYH